MGGKGGSNEKQFSALLLTLPVPFYFLTHYISGTKNLVKLYFLFFLKLILLTSSSYYSRQVLGKTKRRLFPGVIADCCRDTCSHKHIRLRSGIPPGYLCRGCCEQVNTLQLKQVRTADQTVNLYSLIYCTSLL